MASSKLVLSALLLAVLSAVVTATNPDPGVYCRVGRAIPSDPLPGCRQYLTHRCAVGDDPKQVPDQVKRRCCRELADLPRECRCDALSILVHGLVTEQGARVGRMEAVPGCDRERIASMASFIPHISDCYLPTAAGDFCPLFEGGMK